MILLPIIPKHYYIQKTSTQGIFDKYLAIFGQNCLQIIWLVLGIQLVCCLLAKCCLLLQLLLAAGLTATAWPLSFAWQQIFCVISYEPEEKNAWFSTPQQENSNGFSHFTTLMKVGKKDNENEAKHQSIVMEIIQIIFVLNFVC